MSCGLKAGPVLVLRVGGLGCVLPLACVVETMRPQPVRALARTPGFVRGASLIRGEVLPVVELGLLLGTEVQEARRLVVVRAGERKVALAVEEVVGVRSGETEGLGQAPPLLGGAQPGVVSALGSLDGELLAVLDSGRLVPEDVWSSLKEEA